MGYYKTLTLDQEAWQADTYGTDIYRGLTAAEHRIVTTLEAAARAPFGSLAYGAYWAEVAADTYQNGDF